VSERLLTARELAELLGFSASTVVDWSERGELPGFKVGGRLRFRESEVLEWLEQRRQGGLPSDRRHWHDRSVAWDCLPAEGRRQ
jgi:excisionase family DNA binding protein